MGAGGLQGEIRESKQSVLWDYRAEVYQVERGRERERGGREQEKGVGKEKEKRIRMRERERMTEERYISRVVYYCYSFIINISELE